MILYLNNIVISFVLTYYTYHYAINLTVLIIYYNNYKVKLLINK